MWWIAPVALAAPADLDRAEELEDLALEADQAGRFDEALGMAREARSIREEIQGPEHPHVGRIINRMAASLHGAGDLKAAWPLAKEALAIAEAAHDGPHIDTAAALNTIAALHLAEGHLQLAAPIMERGVAIMEQSKDVKEQNVAALTNNLAAIYANLGDLDRAVPLMEKTLEINVRLFGAVHPEVASGLNNLALMQRMRGDVAGAAANMERALDITERSPEATPIDVAKSASSLGTLRMDLGEYDDADALYSRALTLFEEQLGPDHPRVAQALTQRGTLLVNSGRASEAEPMYLRALAIIEATVGTESLQYTELLDRLGGIATEKGDYETGRDRLNRSLATGIANLGKTHPRVAQTLVRLGFLEKNAAEYEAARAHLERAVAILEPGGENRNPRDLANALEKLAIVHLALGEHAEALEASSGAVELYVATLGPDNPSTLTALNLKASSMAGLGEYTAARVLLEEVLAVQDGFAQSLDSGPNQTLINLGTILQEQGDYVRALELYERALHTAETDWGGRDTGTANLMSNMAGILRSDGRFTEAAELVERAIAIRVELHGPSHPEVAVARANLGVILLNLERYHDAASELESALEIQEATLGPHHRALADTLTTLADTDIRRGDLDKALERVSRSVSIVRGALRPGHPQLASQLRGAARIHTLRGDHEAARRIMTEALENTDRYYRDFLPNVSEREALAGAAALRPVLDAYLHIFNRPEEQEAAWNAALRWKGAVSRAVAGRRHTDDADRKRLAKIRRQVARITLSTERTDEVEARLSALRDQQEQLERALFQATPVPESQPEPTAKAICEAMPPRSVLVDYLSISAEVERPKYVAFVLTNDCQVRRIDLGLRQEMDTFIVSHREALGDLDARLDQRGRRLAERLWTPVQAAVPQAQRWLISSDGAIANVSFAALPAADGGYLVESHTFSYLESAPELLRWQGEKSTLSGVLIAGGLDFGVPEGGSSFCFDRDFPPLPGTEVEAIGLAQRWRKEPVTLLTAADGTEEALIQHLPGKRVVHLATHGFFATERCKSAFSGGSYDPMALSGIVLAGANRTPDPLDPHDGILTAAEVSGLDLTGTQLVVLSGCETGLGEIRRGDGVLGLHRALAAAGVRSVVMSLWAVPDDATASLMEDLYRGLRRRRAPPEALRQAQLKLLAQNRSRYGEARPADWAAFVTSGDWR